MDGHFTKTPTQKLMEQREKEVRSKYNELIKNKKITLLY